MRRNGIARLCTYAAFAATMAVTLGGCSGGLSPADNTTGAAATTATTTPTASSSSGAPTTTAGTALVAAAQKSPTTTNTADNPTQVFALPGNAGLPVVTINSPPVVNFSVIDAAGKHVPGLTLIRDAGKADPACSTSATATTGNVTVAMAKWDTGTYSQGVWQSLISLQRYATTNATLARYSVLEGTTDPKPTTSATYQNPATVALSVDTATGKATVSDPTKQIVGILKENATEGYYTYALATDVFTPLLMANAKDKLNSSSGKIANNGNVAVKDGKTIHRLGLQLCYTDPASGKAVVVNPYLDFTVAADGTATPNTVSATDKTLAPFRQVVDKASCNECHEKLSAHGTRIDPNYCVICHNPGSTDYNTNNPIDLKYMIHAFHRGTSLTKDYQVVTFVAKATDPITKVVTGVGYPQDIRNCAKCHDGSATATHKTTQGNNWQNAPSRNACGGCHNGIDFAKGTGTTITGATTGHDGGIQGNDSSCATCHNAAYVASKHALPADSDASLRTMSAAINKAEVDATTGKVKVTFTMTQAGAAVTGAVTAAGKTAKFTLSGMTLSKLIPGVTGSSSHWQSYTGRWRTTKTGVPLVIQGYSETGSSGTLAEVGSGVYTYTFALLNAKTAGDIRTVDHAHDLTSAAPALPSGARPTPLTAAWTAWDNCQLTPPVGNLCGYVNRGAISTVGVIDTTYNADALHRVGLYFAEASGTRNHDNATYDWVPSGKTGVATHNIIDMTSCRNACHADIRLHVGYNTNLCVTCHTETTYDTNTGASPVTIDVKQIVHKLHMGENLPSVISGTPYKIVNADMSEVAFPQSPANCLVCHLSAAATGYSEATNWKTVPTRAACGTCHDGIDFSKGSGATVKVAAAYKSAMTSYNNALVSYNRSIANGDKATKPTAPAAMTLSGHTGGAQTDDSRCASCHDAGSIVLYHIN